MIEYSEFLAIATKYGYEVKSDYIIDVFAEKNNINGNPIAEYDHVHKVVVHWMGENLKPKYNDKTDKLEIGVYFPITCVKAEDFDYCLVTFRKNLKKMMKEIRINRIKEL